MNIQEDLESPFKKYESKKKEETDVLVPSTILEEESDPEDDSSEEESEQEEDLEEIDEGRSMTIVCPVFSECVTDDDMAEIDPSNIIGTSRTRGIKVDYIKDVNYDDIVEDEEDDADFNTPLDD
ncbi:hypothetical protein PCK2_000485 [Pneumocystis canis]|nr:hypothetical protein PCK2_000485 [Pneumocystis canis]